MMEAKATVDQHRKGILHAAAGAQNFILSRYPPASQLSFFVQNYWVVQWDLRGHAPFCQTILAHPNVNLVFEKNLTRLYGVAHSTTNHHLEDKGWVIGVKFKPGGFYPFWQSPVSELTGRALRLEEVFELDGDLLEQEVLSQPEPALAIAKVEALLTARLPAEDPNVPLVSEIVRLIQEDRSILKVHEAARRAGMHIRTMQRLFDRYVGVSPKWILKRCRLHEAVESMEQGTVPDWTQLCLELGYYDQSHFIRDFKALVGRSPEEYTRLQK
jgi:AraC-like DNA-binding protein